MRGLFAETRAGVETQECTVSSKGGFNDYRDQSVAGFNYFIAIFLSHKCILLLTIFFQDKHVSKWKSATSFWMFVQVGFQLKQQLQSI